LPWLLCSVLAPCSMEIGEPLHRSVDWTKQHGMIEYSMKLTLTFQNSIAPVMRTMMITRTYGPDCVEQTSGAISN